MHPPQRPERILAPAHRSRAVVKSRFGVPDGQSCTRLVAIAEPHLCQHRTLIRRLSQDLHRLLPPGSIGRRAESHQRDPHYGVLASERSGPCPEFGCFFHAPRHPASCIVCESRFHERGRVPLLPSLRQKPERFVPAQVHLRLREDPVKSERGYSRPRKLRFGLTLRRPGLDMRERALLLEQLQEKLRSPGRIEPHGADVRRTGSDGVLRHTDPLFV